MKPNFLPYTFLATLMLLPLFFGGNKPAFLAPFTIIICLLFSFWAYKPKPYQTSRTTFIPLILWCTACFIALLQAVILKDWPIWQATSTTLNQPVAHTWSLNPAATLQNLTHLILYGLIAWLGFTFSQQKGMAKHLIWGLWLAGMLYTLYGLTLYALDLPYTLHLTKQAYLNDLTGPFINRNHMATYMGMMLLLSTGLLLHALRYRQKTRCLVLTFSIPLLATTLLLTHSRAGVASFFIGFTALLLCFSFSKAYKPYRTILLAFLASTFNVLLLTLLFLPAEHTSRFFLWEEDLHTRLTLFQTTWKGIVATFPYGTGLGTFEDIFPSLRDSALGFTTWKRITHAHNTPLQLLLEMGATGFLIIGTYLSLLLICLYNIIQKRHTTLYPALAFACGVLADTHAMIDFSLEIPAISATMACLFGIALGAREKKRSS